MSTIGRPRLYRVLSTVSRDVFEGKIFNFRAVPEHGGTEGSMTFLLHLRRNIARNRSRTFGLMFVVGLTLGIFLILGQVTTSISAYSGQVVASVPNIVTVQSSNESIGGGYFHLAFGQGSTTGLNASIFASVSNTANVDEVQRIYTQPLHLPSNGQASPGSFTCGSSSDPQVLAEDTTSRVVQIISLSGASAITISSGRDLGPGDENSTSAIVSQQYATANNLIVGSSLNVDGHEFTIVGIFSQSCYTLILPYPAASSTLGITDATLLYVYVNQYQNVNSVVSSLQSRFGSSFNVQVLANADRNTLQNAISSIQLGAQFSEYATLATGAAVMVVVMVLMTSRRTKEIGLLKALGYGNGRILGQILVESLIFALLGLPLAFLLSVLAGPSIADLLLGKIGSPNPLGVSPGGGDVAEQVRGSNPFLGNVHFALTPEVVALGVVITIAFGLLGALYPAVRALLLRPMEALRHE